MSHSHANGSGKMPQSTYDKKMQKLQRELVKLQEWVRHEGLKMCVLFEGRDDLHRRPAPKVQPGAAARRPREPWPARSSLR